MSMEINIFLESLKQNLQKVSLFILSFFGKINVKYLIYFIAIQFVIILIAFVTFGLLLAIKEVDRFTSMVDSSQLNIMNGADSAQLASYELLVETLRHEDFLKAQHQLAKSDSIYLVVNLLDSTATLLVKGVTLLEIKISRYEVSKGLKKLPEFQYKRIFSEPLHSSHDYSTIEKFPIVIKKAPRDTTEAQLTEKAPEPPALLDVYFWLEFNENIFLEVRQSENELAGPAKLVRQYNRQKRKKMLSRNFDIITGKSLYFHDYSIKIEIPREEARSLYRALPVKPHVIIRFR